jgi:RNA polymerase sigma factor (sigma-70 family)
MAKPDDLVRYVRRAALARPLAGLTDAGLLDRYAIGGTVGEAAFELLIRRHGPMVLRVCRASLGENQSDDAFQATFLILIRRLRAAQRADCLGAWLFGAARRVCSTARRAAGRRIRHERLAGVRSEEARDGRRLDPDVAVAVHAEVGRLPDAEQTAVVLCDLAGLTYAEAAARLGLTAAAVRGRLARGRDRLRRRLRGQGIGPEAIGFVTVAVPVTLVEATARAGMVIVGQAAGTVPATVGALLAGGLESMIWTKCKAAGLGALTAGVLIAGAVGLNARQQPGTDPTAGNPSNRFFRDVDDGRTVAGAGSAAPSTSAADRQDPGDEVASLVRRAQRQQDQGDAAAALKTFAELDAAAKRWRRLLTDQAADHATTGDQQKSQVPRLAGPSKRPDGDMADMMGSDARTMIGSTARGRAPGDVEARLAAVEAKLDRLLRSLEGGAGKPTRVPLPGQPKFPESRDLPKPGTRPAEPKSPLEDFDRDRGAAADPNLTPQRPTKP